MAALRKRIRVGFEDIKSLVLICNQCQHEYIIPIRDYDCHDAPCLPRVCSNPRCEKRFYVDFESRSETREQRVITSLWDLAHHEHNRPVRLRIDIKGSVIGV